MLNSKLTRSSFDALVAAAKMTRRKYALQSILKSTIAKNTRPNYTFLTCSVYITPVKRHYNLTFPVGRYQLSPITLDVAQ